MRSAIEVANWFIENGQDYELTSLKLQKLLYIAFGVCISEIGEELFYDRIEAWKYGPVIPAVYYSLIRWSSKPITEPISMPDRSTPKIDRNALRHIGCMVATLEKFGSLTASHLVNWTHVVGGPWGQCFDQTRSKEIPREIIADWFIKKPYPRHLNIVKSLQQSP